MSLSTVRTLTVFVLLWPLTKLALGVVASRGALWFQALWFQESDAVAALALSLPRIDSATIELTYMLGVPAAGLSGALVRWVQRKRRQPELLWVALVGLIGCIPYNPFFPLYFLFVLATKTDAAWFVFFGTLEALMACSLATMACWAVARSVERVWRVDKNLRAELARDSRATPSTLDADLVGARTVGILASQPLLAITFVFLGFGPMFGVAGFELAAWLEGARPNVDLRLVLVAYVTGALPAAAVAVLAWQLYRRRLAFPLLPLLTAGTLLSAIDFVGFGLLAPPSVGETLGDFELALRLGRFLAMHLTAVLGCWAILKTLDLGRPARGATVPRSPSGALPRSLS